MYLAVIFSAQVALLLWGLTLQAAPRLHPRLALAKARAYLPPQDTGKRKPAATGYEWKDTPFDATRRDYRSPLFLNPPKNEETIYEPRADGSGYDVYERVGGRNVRPPSFITKDEYRRLLRDQLNKEYFRQRASSGSLGGSGNRLVPPISVNSGLFKDIFGSGKVDIKPNVTVLLDMSIKTNKQQNPSLSIRQQKSSFFDFRQQIQLNVNATLGEKLKFRANYDTQATFNFENQVKVEYSGLEDDVLKKLEFGNVSMPLRGTLITGGQNLFGVKTVLQFGPATITAVASQQRGRTNEIVIKNGQQQQPFVKKASEYDDYRHFFLNHYFRSLYENSLTTLPIVSSPINITRVEVYVTNRASAATSNTRNAVGFVDLAENVNTHGGVLFNTTHITPTGEFADNNANTLYPALVAGNVDRNRVGSPGSISAITQLVKDQDFQLVENMRRLTDQEFVLQPRLGYITLNSKLQPNDVLFVAYEYTVVNDPTVHKVGEFSTDVPADPTNSNVLFLKMLKPNLVLPSPFPTWDLMMKNVYSLGAFNISPDGFRLDVVYESTIGSGDINYLPTSAVKDRPLIQVVRLDRLHNNNELGPDNRFDFLPGVTILPDKGLIYFPLLEPFGQDLIRISNNGSDPDSSKYAFPQLYRRTMSDAVQLYPQQNRFKMQGYYASGGAGGDVFLNAVQIVPGSVKVTANGAKLTEGTDYTVDYQVGKVTFLNSGLRASGQEIHITYESNTLFGIDQKTMLGTRVDYKLGKKVNLGATGLYLYERPLINKVVIGQEPMANLLFGLDGSVTTQSRKLTQLLNKLPFYNSNVPSEISFTGEVAELLPGQPKQISVNGEKGTAYIDDFEGTQSYLDLNSQVQAWVLASHPPSLPTEPDTSGTALGNRRAKLAWYSIDPRFYDRAPDFGLSNNSPALNTPYSRRVGIQEVFPAKTVGTTNFLPTFDLHYFPAQRGPNNYQADVTKLNHDGSFRNPTENWAGIMRRTTGNTDFEAANFEFIDIWVMDPFLANPQAKGGDLYINLGKVSEDILPDGQRAYENGLPTSAAADAANQDLTLTPWGRVPNRQVPVSAFDNNTASRPYQDVGLDGLPDAEEPKYFNNFLTKVGAVVTDVTANNRLRADPSSDDFSYFINDNVYPSGTDILSRYVNYNGTEGNSPISAPSDVIAKASTTLPDVEDINQDGTLNTTELFWEYHISMRPHDLQVGRNYIINKQVSTIKLANGQDTSAVWYQLRIPLRAGQARNGIQNFKSIDFLRMYMTQFTENTILRLGSFRLIATQWRSYVDSLSTVPSPLTTFNVATLSIEENSSKQPFNYTVPPGVQRQGVPASAVPNQLQNEQSLQLKVSHLLDGDYRAAFKTVDIDMRFYERVKLFLHAEDTLGMGGITQGDANAFLRLGTDQVFNYYEYELPLTLSRFGDNSVDNIWPAANLIDVALSDLNAVKIARDNAHFPLTQPYTTVLANGHKITVVGTPQLNHVKDILIGIRNPKNGTAGPPITLELWADELRASNFNDTPGWAATGKLNLKLADLGTMQFSGLYSTPGFGGVQQRVSQRSLEYTKRYDIAINLQLGKLLPKKLGLEVPTYVTYGERTITPRYNPLDQDVLLSTYAENTSNPAQAYRRSIDYSRTYSYAFTNVRRVRQNANAKQKPWDIENVAVSYAHGETFARNAQLDHRLSQTYKGSFLYTVNFSPKNYQPFKRKDKPDNLFTAFNFYLLPKTFSFRLDADRIYEEEQLRDVSNTGFIINPTYNQNFTITRTHNLRWDLTKSLGFTFTAINLSRVDEPFGKLDTPEKRDTFYNKIFHIGRDTAHHFYNFINLGRTLNYTQTLASTYKLPFDKIKLLNWITASIAYNADYRWTAAALQNTSLGNTLSNSRIQTVNAQFNLGQFYKRYSWINKLLKPIPKKTIYSKNDTTRQEGDEASVAFKNIYKAFARVLFSVQNVDVNYNHAQSTVLPGWLPHTSTLGMDWNFISPRDGRTPAPGWDFILGQQPNLTPGGFLGKARQHGWLAKDPRQVTPFGQTESIQLTGRTSVTLFKGFKVDLNINKNQTSSRSAAYAFDTTRGIKDYQLSNRLETGTYAISFLSIGSAFRSGQQSFDALQHARIILSHRLHQQNLQRDALLPNPGLLSDGYYNGYTATAQDVLVPAFLSAYGPYGGPNKVGLSPFPSVPLPNWNVNYTGLSDVWFMKSLFKTVTLTHSYKSSYSTSYILNLRALDANGNPAIYQADSATQAQNGGPAHYNFQPQKIIQSLTIAETFAPLLGVNLAFQNGLALLLDYKKSRMSTLSTGALQLTEARTEEFTTSLSLKRDRFALPISLFGKLFELKNSITFRFEVTYRTNKTQNFQLDAGLPPQPTAGNTTFTIKPSIDYNVSTQLTARAYYERTVNRPTISTSYPTTYTAVGVQLRFTLQ